jgi:preprotein translocase subunit SecY
MLGGLGEVGKIPELKKRILFTLFILAVYRFGVFVSTPGIDVLALRSMLNTGGGGLVDFINLFSGGALENFSIFTLGITPYISVSIIVQMMTPITPALEALKKEGEAGQRVLTRYIRQGTILLALFQAFMIALGLEGQGVVATPGWWFRISTMLTMTAGTSLMMWFGEQITERGIGNGVSVLIFAGIIAQMPGVFGETIALARYGQLEPMSVLLLIAFTVASIAAIVFVERSHRRIPIQYPRRVVGKNLAQAPTQYMPLKLNMAGVMPPILASALFVVPGTIAQFSANETLKDLMGQFAPGTFYHDAIYVVLIVLFSYFWTAHYFNPVEVSDNLKKNGGFIPTVRPGKPTADYLYGVTNRLTLWGAIYLSLICLVPQAVYVSMEALSFAYVFGGTAILIVVGVTLDTASQIESHIVAKNYEAFMAKGSKVRGPGPMGQPRSRLIRR